MGGHMNVVVVSASVIEELLRDVSFIHKYFGVEAGRRRLVGLLTSLQALREAAQNEDLVAAREAAAMGRREYEVERARLLEALNERTQ